MNISIHQTRVTVARIITAVIAVAALPLVSGTSLAGPAAVGDTPSQVVRFDARSLGTADGARDVYTRLAAAARAVCGDESRDLARESAVQQCRKQAVARAVRDISNPRLVETATRAAHAG